MKGNVKNLRVVKPGVAIHLFVSLVTVGFCFVACAADARVVVDSAGRRVEVPAKIERVFAAGAPAGVFIYTLAPEKLLNWNLPLTPKQRAYMPTRYAELPALGRLTGRGNTASVETVLAARPDVIFDYGTINPTYISLADRVQKQTGVPYLLFDGTFDQVARIYESAGAARCKRESSGFVALCGAVACRRRQTVGAAATGEAAVGLLRARAARLADRPQGLDQRREHRANRCT